MYASWNWYAPSSVVLEDDVDVCDGAGAVRRYFLGDYGEPTGRTAIVCPTGAAQELGGDLLFRTRLGFSGTR